MLPASHSHKLSFICEDRRKDAIFSTLFSFFPYTHFAASSTKENILIFAQVDIFSFFVLLDLQKQTLIVIWFSTIDIVVNGIWNIAIKCEGIITGQWLQWF